MFPQKREVLVKKELNIILPLISQTFAEKNLNYTDVWLAEDTVSTNLRRLRELKIN